MLLRQPDRFLLQADIDFDLSIWGLVNKEFGVKSPPAKPEA